MADAGKIVITPKGVYSSTSTYEWLDEVTYDGKSYIALKTVTGVTPIDDGVNWRLFLDPNDIIAGNLVPTFTEASTRSNIISEENLSTILGKVKKYFTDLKGHAFKDIVNNLTTSTTGSALDASQGKVLKDEVDETNSNLDDLAYGEFAGGKNLFTTRYYSKNYDGNTIVNGENSVTITSSYYSIFVMKLDANTNYTFSVDGDTPSVLGIYDSISNTKIQETKNNKTVTFNTGNYTNISIYVYSAIGTTATKTFTKMQLEKGSSATAYEPYIMSNKQLGALNESLGDYGLDGIHNIEMLQGYPSNEDITVTHNNSNYVCSKNTYECNGDDKIVVKNKYTNGLVYFYDSSKAYISGSEFPCTAPTNAKYFRFRIGYVENITPQTVGKISVYINNAIDEIKNNLDKLNSLPKGSIIQIEADKDDTETTTQKYGWQYLGTSNIQYENGSANILVTNVYRKNN